MTQHACLFTPKSKFKTVWELFIIILALLISLLLPFAIAMKPPFTEYIGYEIFMLLIDLLFFIDIIFTFRSATFDIMTGEEVSEPGHIARKYAFSFKFILDILSCLPWD
jgi:Ion transport protein